jgi:hypothetical protein
MQYEEKLTLLDENDFFRFFEKCRVEPRWVISAGKRAIQVLGFCHGGDSHSALFDPDTLKMNCFSLCGGGMLLHTFVKRALNLTSSQEAKDCIEKWIENQNLDLSNRIARRMDFEYEERPYSPEKVPPLDGMNPKALEELKDKFQYDLETLSKLSWCRIDGIKPEILSLYEVMYSPSGKDGKDGSIILPHHNVNGDIVGLYERSFLPIRSQVKKEFPDISHKQLLRYPRAKYVPILRDEKYQDIENKKTSWSFSNSKNLYGLHIAKDGIKEKKIAIIFEGGKSVMLGYQYGYRYCVATHTFGAHLNHISMLIECGANEIVLGFDKQYQKESGQEWELYQRKTLGLAAKVGKFCKVSCIIDRDGLLDFKDAPIDKGKQVFEKLFVKREVLTAQPKENKNKSENNDKKIKLSLDQIEKNKEKKRRSAILMQEGLEALLWRI